MASSGHLQEELKKREPFDSAEQEALLNILKTSDRIQNKAGKLFREYRLTSSQYNVLKILRSEAKPLPSLEIASRMIQVVPAITGLIDRLEAQGFVERQRCDQDRRVVYVAITENGMKLLDEMDTPVNEMHKSIMGHLTEKELGTLSELLTKVRRAEALQQRQ